MLARIRQVQRLAQKTKAPAAREDPPTPSRAKTPLKRPWSKLNALAHKKQKAGEAGTQARPKPPAPSRSRKKP